MPATLRLLLGMLLLGAVPAAETEIPGRAEAVAPSASFACTVAWEEYHSVIVVEDGRHPRRRRAWVATRERDTGHLAVAYTGTAFVDARGDIHIDCRNATISGPMAARWSPDSFAIEPDGRVRVIDDQDRGNVGRLVDRHPARDPGGAALTPAYRERRLAACAAVIGAL